MALTNALIRSKAIAQDKPFKLEDSDGMYLLVAPDGALSWHLQFVLDEKQKEITLGDYPALSLADARKKRAEALRLVAQGIAPKIPKKAPVKEKHVKNTAPKEAPLPLIAYRLNNNRMPIITGPNDRLWMDQTPSRFAYRCMPMLISNQSGWMILSNHRISVIWDGRQALEGVRINCLSGDPGLCNAVSIFGSGILTFTLPYLFRTPPGYNLVAQGPTNRPKDGISALSGVIETDWAEATFTMNWMITRPHHAITFEKDEPICMIIPQKRYEIERFQPIIRDITSDPELNEDYLKWAESRRKFNEDLKVPGSKATKDGWQKHYTQGKTITEKRSTSHQSKLNLREAIDESTDRDPLHKIP